MADETQSWEEPDVDELNEDLADSYSGFAESFQPKPGDNKLRVCPPRAGAKFYQRVDMHYGIGPKNRTYPCARSISEDEACILCDIAEELKTSDDPARQAEYKQVKAKKRYLISVVDLAAPDKGIQIWRAPTTVWRDIVMIIRDPDFRDVDGHTILNPLTGRNIKVIVSGQKMNTDYTVQAMPTATKFPLELTALDDLPDLLDSVTFADDTEMETAYYDTGDGEGDGDDYEPPVDAEEAEAVGAGEPYEPEAEAPAEEPEAEVEAEPARPAVRRAAPATTQPAPTRRAPAAPAAPVRRAAPRPAAQPAKAERAPVGRPLKPQTARATRPAANGSTATRTEVRRKAATARSR